MFDFKGIYRDPVLALDTNSTNKHSQSCISITPLLKFAPRQKGLCTYFYMDTNISHQ
jgi:hypothetical protein